MALTDWRTDWRDATRLTFYTPSSFTAAPVVYTTPSTYIAQPWTTTITVPVTTTTTTTNDWLWSPTDLDYRLQRAYEIEQLQRAYVFEQQAMLQLPDHSFAPSIDGSCRICFQSNPYRFDEAAHLFLIDEVLDITDLL
jgi:hypothetical protein